MARDLVYEPDQLFLPDEQINVLVSQAPTPFYLYDAQGIRATAAQMLRAFSWNSGYRQFFPVKATNAPGILKLLLQAGMGLLCTTWLELELAKRVGAEAGQILFVPVFPSEQDLIYAANWNVHTIIDSEQVFERLIQAAKLPERIGLRYHPEKRIEAGPRVLARTEGSKFGMDTREMVDVSRRLMKLGVKEIGLHCHLTGNLNAPQYWGQILQVLHDAARQLIQKTGIGIAYYDIGGGLAIPGDADMKESEIQSVSDFVQRKAQELGIEQVPIFTEFGRYVTGPHGLLLSRVCYVKPYDEPRPLVGIDAGITKMMRHLAFKTNHHISVVGKLGTERRRFYSLAGALSESKDQILHKRLLPQLEVGDIIAVHNIGAYGAVMDLPYAGQLRCAEYLYDDGKFQCLRRAESAEEYFSPMIFLKRPPP